MNRLPTGAEIRELRQALGMTQRELGLALYLEGDEPDRHIRYLESEGKHPSGPLVRALELIAEQKGVRAPWL